MKTVSLPLLFLTRVILPIFSILPTLPALAQATLIGLVRTEAGKPMAFVSLALLDARDSTLVKGTISRETGSYTFENVRPGEYRLAASAVGYAPGRSERVLVGTAPVTFPTLTLRESAQTLSDVTVRTKKPLYEQQVDRLVINVQNSIVSAGGTALEVLERSPGISVNRQSNTLTLNGKSGLLVMMNGKLTRLPLATVVQMLDGMNANDIEKIELITTPPAKYDAEGDAGIINIIAKKNTSYGTNGNLSATFGHGWFARPAATLNLNSRSRQLNLYGSYSILRSHSWGTIDYDHTLTQTGQTLTTSIAAERFPLVTNQSARLGFDFSLSPQTTLNGLVSGFDNRWTMASSTASDLRTNDVLTKRNSLATDEINHWQHLLLNVNLRHVFKNKQEWSFDADRLYYHDSNPTAYRNDIQDYPTASSDRQQFRVSKETPIQTWVLKTDWLQPLATGRLESGLKATMTQLDNAVELTRLNGDQWSVDSSLSQQYHFRENVLAGYVSLNRSLASNTTVQAGLRYEYTQTDLNTPDGTSLIHWRYGNLFPSVFVTHKLAKNHALNLSYSRRITRPSYNDIAPFVFFFDPNTYVSGNPKLRPTISDALQASYTFKETYVFSLKYSYDQNVIASFQPHVDPVTNRLYYYAENVNQQHTVSLAVSLPWQLTRWWKSQTNLTGLWQNLTLVYQGQPVLQTAWSALLTSSHTFTLPHQFTAELTGLYGSPSVYGVQRSAAYSQVTVGIQKLLPNNKGTLKLTASDLFWTYYFRYYSRIPTLNLNEQGIYRAEPRVVRLTYTRNFGSQTVKAAKSRATGSEEERTRLMSN